MAGKRRVAYFSKGFCAVLLACSSKEHVDTPTGVGTPTLPTAKQAAARDPLTAAHAAPPAPSFPVGIIAGPSSTPRALSLLDLLEAGARGPRHVALGNKAAFAFHHPEKLKWADVFVGTFAAFLPNGNTESVHRESAAGGYSHTFTVPGSTAVGLCTGPKSIANRGNAWALVTHCSKLVFQVGSARPPSLPLMKFGQAIEVRPLMTLERLAPGAPLPLVFYDKSAKQRQTPVRAYRPDGSIEQRATNGVGVAEFDVSMPGRWLIRIEKENEGGWRIGEIAFDVGGAQ
jgi:hypothetical protein